MRVVVQRVASATLTVEGSKAGSIGPGLVVFLGIHRESRTDDAVWLAEKILKLRLWDPPDSGHPASITDTGGDLMVISQFTLHASTRKGTRPSYHRAAPPSTAEPLYQHFIEEIRQRYSGTLVIGTFGAHMNVHLDNDGPITLIIDSQNRE